MVGYLEIPVAGKHGSVKLVKKVDGCGMKADGCWKKTGIKSTLKMAGFTKNE